MIVCSHRRNCFVVLPSGYFHSFQIYDTATFRLPVAENVSNQVVGQIKYLFYEISQNPQTQKRILTVLFCGTTPTARCDIGIYGSDTDFALSPL